MKPPPTSEYQRAFHEVIARVQQALDTAWQSVALAAPLVTDSAFDAFFKVPSPGSLILGSGYPDVTLQPATLLEKAAQRAARQRAHGRG